MKEVAARAGTYGIIGLMAWVAILFTPPVASPAPVTDPAALAATNRAIAATAVATLDPVIVTTPASSVPEISFKPVVVEALKQHHA